MRAFLLVFFLAVTTLACHREGGSLFAHSAPTGWSRVTDPDERFSVLMPEGASRQVVAMKSGGRTYSWKARSQFGSTYYVACVDAEKLLEPDPRTALHAFVSGVVKGMHGKLIEAVDGREGVDLLVVFEVADEKGGKHVGVVRGHSGRVYVQLMTLVPGEPEENWKRFVRSLET